jgi:uncharacterized protein
MGATRHDIPLHECFDLLASTHVGRLCIIDHGYPLAFPVNFRVVRNADASTVVVRVSPESSLARYEGLSSIEVDDINADGLRAWSVMVRGRLRRVYGAVDFPDTEPFVSDRRHQWLGLEVAVISGRRFRAVSSGDAFSVDWQTVGN